VALSASNVSSQAMLPWPGVLRSFSEMWTWIVVLARLDRFVALFDIGVERAVHHPAAQDSLLQKAAVSTRC
jgi:hypothetical protein